MIIVEYPDRPDQLRAEHPTAALPAQGRRIMAGNQGRNHDPVRAVTATTQDRPVEASS